MKRALVPALMLLVATASALLYFHDLGSSPPYLSIDEVFQARDAVALAATGRSLNGEFLPLYFPDPGLPLGREPVFIYLGAALLRVLPFSHAVARAPSAAAGVLNVVLIFLVAREMFGRTGPAVTAAVLLMLSPAHFLQSRIGHNQIGTVTAGLAWMLFLVRFFNRNRSRDLVIASFCLGVGMYVYASGLVIMPVFFLVTLVLATRVQTGGTRSRAVAAVVAGFAIAVLPLVVWYVVHPERFAQVARYYTGGEYNRSLGWRGFLGSAAISHLDAWWDCYNPDKLFFSGDADLRFSTRTAGYFLLSAGVPLAAGLCWGKRLVRRELWLLLILGLALSPLPAALVTGSDVKRFLMLLPFAVLVAACGAQMLTSGTSSAVRMAAAGLVMIARWVTPLPSAVLAAGAGLIWLGARTSIGARACIVALVALGVVQGRSFLDYYHGQFRFDSSPYYGGNVHGAVKELLAVSAPQDCILLDTRVYYLEDEFDLYTRAAGRDLMKQSNWLSPGDVVNPPASCRGTTAIALDSDPRFAGWTSIRIAELNGSVQIAVYRRNSS